MSAMELRIRTFVPEYIAQLVWTLHYLAGEVNVAARFNHEIAGTEDFRFELCLTMAKKTGERRDRNRVKEKEKKGEQKVT